MNTTSGPPAFLKDEDDDAEDERMKSLLYRVVSSPAFEGFFACLIVVNTAMSVVEVQYSGALAGRLIAFDAGGPVHATRNPGLESAFHIMRLVFGVIFTIELLLKALAFGRRFFRSSWNLFDSMVVAFWIVNSAGGAVFNPMILRMCRLARLLRLVRFLKFLAVFDTLHLLIGSLKASISVLIWSTVLLFFIMLVCALTLSNLMQGYITGVDGGLDRETRHQLYKFFGTFTRSFVTMSEVTLANWVPVCRLLMDNVSEVYALGFLCYRGVVGFAVVKVITGVFMHETFKVASSDDELMIIQRDRQLAKHVVKMQRFFMQADKSGNGTLTWNEFHAVIADPKIQSWLSAMELDVHDVKNLFTLIDDTHGAHDNQISVEELAKGVGRLKGVARSIDVATLMRETRIVTHDLHKVKRMIGTLDTRMHELIVQRQPDTPIHDDKSSKAPPTWNPCAIHKNLGAGSAEN